MGEPPVFKDKNLRVLPPDTGGGETGFLFQLSLIAGMGKRLFEKSIPVIWLRVRPSRLVELKF